MLGSQRSGVFLSYARADGEQFAQTIRERLCKLAPDIVIKQDRLLLEGGVGWWKQLTGAIDSVEFLILVMTPSAMQSPNVRKEWRYARQQGVCVYPVKAASDAELHFSQLPRWMSKAHFFDLDREWDTFIAHLRKGCDTPRVPFMAPDLPENFIQRPDEFGRLKDLLLSSDRKESVAITTALSGAGGFGKTTLATALCHDEDVIQNFDDGILWVALGENPNILNSLVTVYAALTGERPGFADAQDAAFQLGQKLEDRNCLLVIDDVWDDAHLRPFRRGGKGCGRLFTTRNAEIAANARTVNVDEMRESESVAMLTKGVPGLHASKARYLSQRLGEWPLALELARAMMRQRMDQGDSAERAADRLLQILDRKGPRGLSRGTGDARHRTIDGVLEGSLELLSTDDRKRLAELSIFPEDVAIPLSAAAALWQFDEFEAEEVAQRFAALYLLKLDLARGSMRLHDVMRSWLAAQAGNETELHSCLVDAWPDWIQLPDAYAWRWFTWHLAAASRTADLERILFDPAWLQAKLDATDVNALISDFDRLKSSPDAELIQGAIRLSSHVLAKDPGQFASQMVGRLLPHNKRPAVRHFADSLTQTARQPWLRPVCPALDPPGTGLLRTLVGHAGSVNGVALSADGHRAVSVEFDDRTLEVWDVESGAALRTLFGHTRPVTGVGLSADGRRAVSSSDDWTLKVWDVDSGAELCTLAGHTSGVTSVAISADGRRAVSGSDDSTVKLWDLENGAEVRTLLTSRFVDVVALNWDSRHAFIASGDQTLKIWDLETGAELRAFARWVRAAAISADNRRVASVSTSDDRVLKVWDMRSGDELHSLVGHSGPVNCIALNADGQRAVSGSDDRTLKVWDLEAGVQMYTLNGHAGRVTGVRLSADGRRAVSASSDHTLKVWDLERGAEHRMFHGNSGPITLVAMSQDGRRAVSASSDHTLKVWDLGSGSELHILAGHSGSVTGVVLSADGQRAVSASDDMTLKVWDLETGFQMYTLAGHSSPVRAVALSADGRRAVSASNDRILKVWDLQNGVELRTLATQSTPDITSVTLSADGQTLSAFDGLRGKVWNVESGVELRRFNVPPSAPWSSALGADGRIAVFGSWNESKVWDLETGTELRTIAGSRYLSEAALSPDARWAAYSRGASIKVLDLENSATIATFTCDASVRCCAFPGSTTILAGDDAGRLHFLSLELPQ